ncbi:MAG: ComF family protein, partial [Gemmatimonadales bacterium]
MRPWLARWHSFAAGWERRLLPAECLLCRERLGAEPDEPLVCAVCRSRWRRLPHPLCARCGQPIDAFDACRLCADWPPGFGGVQSAVWLDESARRAVHLFKYEGWWRVAGSLAAAMDGLDALAGVPVLIPVPLGAARERARGYNQSAKLAAALSVRLGLPIR